jgi:hypothetical protein
MRHQGTAAAAGLLSLFATGVASAAPTQTAHHTKIINDCFHARYEPHKVLLLCGDGTQGLTHIHYTSWTGKRATGHARFVYDDCQPNCAQGHTHHYRVTFVFKRVRKDGDARVFTRVVTHHNGKKQTYDVGPGNSVPR